MLDISITGSNDNFEILTHSLFILQGEEMRGNTILHMNKKLLLETRKKQKPHTSKRLVKGTPVKCSARSPCQKFHRDALNLLSLNRTNRPLKMFPISSNNCTILKLVFIMCRILPASYLSSRSHSCS